MSVYSQNTKDVTLGFTRDQCKLQLVSSPVPIVHDTAIGRIAFSCPWNDQEVIRDAVKSSGQGKILNELIELPTPGKATVRVLILTDPDGYEICFVGDEGYRLLSQIDPAGDELLIKAIAEDKSAEWFAKKGQSKIQA